MCIGPTPKRIEIWNVWEGYKGRDFVRSSSSKQVAYDSGVQVQPTRKGVEDKYLNRFDSAEIERERERVFEFWDGVTQINQHTHNPRRKLNSFAYVLLTPIIMS